MKNWFVVSFAVMAFLVACGKKEKKQGEIGKTVAGSALDCKVKDKENASCKEQNKGTTPPASENAGKSAETKVSGTEEQKQSTEQFPNQKNANIMSLHLNENSGITAELLLSSTEDDSKYTASQVSCADVKDLTQANLTEKILNPDKLENVSTKIYLLNNSQLLTKLRVKTGDGAGEKPYMISCKNGSSVSADSFEKSADYQVKKLDAGVSTLDVLSTSKNGDEGVLTSIQCASEEDFVKDFSESKKVLSDNYVLNRIKLNKGSSILFARAINMKFEDKKLSDLDAKFKEQRFVVVTCK